MVDEKNDELDINLKNMGLDDENPTDLDSLLSVDAETISATLPSNDDIGEIADDDVGEAADDDFIDFNDFSIDDLDTALSKYEADPSTPEISQMIGTPQQAPASVSTGRPAATLAEIAAARNMNQPQAEKVVEETLVETIFDPTSETIIESPKELQTESMPEEIQAESVFEQIPEMPIEKASFTKTSPVAAPAAIAEPELAEEYVQLAEDEKVFKNLTWYDGTLGEKVYEISLINMPEFLDYNKDIKTLHINIDSAYGWNVFFENGVFMNLLDLKEYQERHGNMPGTSGKIIYGNKTTAFERIERIVVYEKPRYFSYGVQK